ncbi:hypothetical protein POPTR_004G077301v4 [Populus trichocarpa]|uniref:Uncharacterized protein n=1 Tax=Populus trichocarpa TaxID=3694 RepID=A0ACC0T3F3_POPTR|nr:hypothetical protein POPTR_004G077301v4 [Populus trichocarpa]
MLCSLTFCLQPQTRRPSGLLPPPLRTGESSTLFTLSKPCDELQIDPNGIFKFAVDIDLESSLKKEAIREIKVTWNVVLRGWKAVFNMMESCSGKASLVPEAEDLFSKELPLPGCCSNMVTASSLVAEIKLGFCSENYTDEEEGIEDDGKFKRGKLSLAIMNTKHWRYLSMDDALRHLQHFLLPCDAYVVLISSLITSGKLAWWLL